MTKGKISILLVFCLAVSADKMTHQFKSPSFSGVGTSSHYLTIENQELNNLNHPLLVGWVLLHII